MHCIKMRNKGENKCSENCSNNYEMQTLEKQLEIISRHAIRRITSDQDGKYKKQKVSQEVGQNAFSSIDLR